MVPVFRVDRVWNVFGEDASLPIAIDGSDQPFRVTSIHDEQNGQIGAGCVELRSAHKGNSMVSNQKEDQQS